VRTAGPQGAVCQGAERVDPGCDRNFRPNIPPVNPELTIDSSTMTPAEAVQEIMLYLEEQGYIS
jgi:hypothetical protein